MFIKKLLECPQFIAGDNTVLREMLHPDKADLELRYSLAHATLGPGLRSKPHKLKTSEVYYILTGEGKMSIDDETALVGPGDTIYIPPTALQFIENTGTTDLVFICIVDPAWREEDEIVFD